MTTLKLSNIDPDDYILAMRAAKSFMLEDKAVGVRHGTVYSYGPLHGPYDKSFSVYRTKTMIVVRKSGGDAN